MNMTDNLRKAADLGLAETLKNFVLYLGYSEPRLAGVTEHHAPLVDAFARGIIDAYEFGRTVASATAPARHGTPQTPKLPSALDEQVGGNHYKGLKVQPVEFTEVNGLTGLECSIIKRACRHSRGGGGMKDINKIIHEARLIAKIQYGEDV